MSLSREALTSCGGSGLSGLSLKQIGDNWGLETLIIIYFHFTFLTFVSVYSLLFFKSIQVPSWFHVHARHDHRHTMQSFSALCVAAACSMFTPYATQRISLQATAPPGKPTTSSIQSLPHGGFYLHARVSITRVAACLCVGVKGAGVSRCEWAFFCVKLCHGNQIKRTGIHVEQVKKQIMLKEAWSMNARTCIQRYCCVGPSVPLMER